MMRQSLVYAKNVLRLVGVIEICLEDLARHLWYLLLSPGSPIQFPKFRKLVDQPRRWATIHISPPGLSQEGASVELSKDGKSSISSDCVSFPPISISFIGGACSAACCLASNGSAIPPISLLSWRLCMLYHLYVDRYLPATLHAEHGFGGALLDTVSFSIAPETLVLLDVSLF